MKQVLIIGAGAIGIALGASLYEQNMDVVFQANSNTKKAIEEGGIKRTGLFGDISVPAGKVAAYGDLQEIPAGTIDCVLVCTKTLANETVAQQLAKHKEILTTDGKIVILQNGWGNDTPFLEHFPVEQIYQARVITGFARTAPNISNITVHTAPILLGSLHGCDVACMEPLAKAISDSGIPSETTEQLAEALWAKMLYNTTLNPLGAILHLPYGKLADCSYSKAIMDRLIQETFAVMDACGYHTFWENAEAYQKDFYGKLIPDTYEHRSSTLQDIEKKQQTEIHTLNGCIVSLAEKHGIQVPTHRMICEMILTLEANF